MYDEEDLLKRFDEYIEDPEAFYTIFQYLPTGYQYIILLKLLELEKMLIPADTRKGTPTMGIIRIENRQINLYDKEDNKHVLTYLPRAEYL